MDPGSRGGSATHDGRTSWTSYPVLSAGQTASGTDQLRPEPFNRRGEATGIAPATVDTDGVFGCAREC
jgi:hypothetical protein